jgi:hypothetical protein
MVPGETTLEVVAARIAKRAQARGGLRSIGHPWRSRYLVEHGEPPPVPHAKLAPVPVAC